MGRSTTTKYKFLRSSNEDHILFLFAANAFRFAKKHEKAKLAFDIASNGQ